MPTTVSGNIKNLATGSVGSSQNAILRFILRGTGESQPVITGTGAIAPTSANGIWYTDLAADANGAVSGTIYSTRDATGLLAGDITVSGSGTAVYYDMVVIANGMSGPSQSVHAKNGATLDPSSVTPITTPPVVSAPTGDGTYGRLDGGNTPATGLWEFNAGILTKKVNLVRWADQYSGSDVGAKINAAIADLPSGGGVVDCRGFGPGTQTISTTISGGSESKRIKFLFDESTIFVPSSTSTDVFAVQPLNIVDGLTIDCSSVSSYAGNAIKFSGATFDGNIAQKTTIKNCRINGSGLTTGNGVLIQSDDTNYVSWVLLDDIRIAGFSNGVYCHGTGSSTGKWITDVKADGVVCYGSVIGFNLVADKGNIEGCIFDKCSYENGTNTTYGFQLLNNGGGTFASVHFDNINIWDTASSKAGNIGSGVLRTRVIGRWDGSINGNAGGTTNDAGYGTFLNSRFADSGTAVTFGSYGGIWNHVHSGNGFRWNAVDLNKAYHLYPNASSRVQLDGVSIGTAAEFDPAGPGTVYAGTGGGTFIGAAIYNGSGSTIAIPNGVSGGTVGQVIASGTSTLTSNATLAAVTSQTAITTAATGAATTDAIEWCYASAPGSGDALCHVSAYVTSGNVNFVRTNPTAASQNVSAIVINWRVIR